MNKTGNQWGRGSRYSAVLALCLVSVSGMASAAAQTAAWTPSTTSSALNLDPATKKPSDYWQSAVARFRSMETTAPKHGTVLIGDSITNRWPEGMFPGENVINRGIGSDHIGGWNYFGLIDRLDTSIGALEPKRVFVMIGVNDMLPGGAPMDNMVESYGYLLDQMKKLAPDAEIIVQSVLPVSKPEFAYMHKPINELNSHLRTIAARRGLRYVDLHKHFQNEKGELKAELTKDGVHLTPEGYKLWLDVLVAEGLVKADDQSSSHTIEKQ